jgi:hypothetical protein
MNNSHPKPPGTWRAVLFLFVVATLIPELLIGSTPLSRINQLIFEFPYYGSAALLVREAVIRFKLGRAGLILLGLAFGVVTEGLSLQSIFNPHFLNLDISYGRAGEVNWVWMFYMVGYHAIWSITIPVTLAGLVFRERRQESWLGRIGLGGFLVLFVVMAFAFHAIFVKMSNFRAPNLPYSVAAIVVGLLIAAGLCLKARPANVVSRPVPTWLPGIFMALAGIFWLLLYGEIFRKPHLFPVEVNLPLGLMLAVGFRLLLPRWAPADASDRRQFSLLAGGLAANTAFGFVVVSTSRLDTYGQIGIVVLLGVALAVLARTLRPV